MEEIDSTTEDYDFVDFETRDQIDEEREQAFRELATGLPARPGVKR